MSNYVYIYRDPRKLNEPIYVGRGKGKRFEVHAKGHSHNIELSNKISKMIRDGFAPVIEIIETENTSALETCLIKKFGRKDLKAGPLLNRTDGGDGSENPGPETRAKLSKAAMGNKRRLGKFHSQETKDLIGRIGKGKKRSEKQIQAMRITFDGEKNPRALEWEVIHPGGRIEQVKALGSWIKSYPTLSKA